MTDIMVTPFWLEKSGDLGRPRGGCTALYFHYCGYVLLLLLLLLLLQRCCYLAHAKIEFSVTFATKNDVSIGSEVEDCRNYLMECVFYYVLCDISIE